VDEVVGVEGSRRRVEVCAENAARLGISNATFIYVEPGMTLPFPDGNFDGIMAASSVEQTPDPRATLCELHRILRPGGRLRICYEALSRYRDGEEREIWLCEISGGTCRVMLYDRDIENERARQYGLTFAMSCEEVTESLAADGRSLSVDMVTIPFLEKVRSTIIDVRLCSLTHPSASTFVSWLRDIGFRHVIPSHSGAWFAGQLFDRLPEDRRPSDMKGVDELLRPVVKIAVRMMAPADMDPMITGIK